MRLICNSCGSYQGMSEEASLYFFGVNEVSAALDDTLASACETNDTARELVYKVACAEPAASLIVCEYLLCGQLGIAEVICDNAVCVYAEFADRRAAVEKMLAESALSDEAKSRYLFRFHDRLRAIAQ